jgi:hypothetical protein
VLVRWLSPVVLVLALLLQTAGYATAGVVNIVMCCCPDIEACTCHEHDEPGAPTNMGRCGGAVDEVAPLLASYTLPAQPVARLGFEPTAIIEYELPIPSDADPREPEKPPF